MAETIPKILIVDAGANAQDLKLRLSSLMNVIIDSARGLSEALKVIPKVQPDLVLFDITTLGTNIFDACKKLKSRPETADTVIFFMAGKQELPNIVDAFNCGISDYVIKPINIHDLCRRIKTHLELKFELDKLKEAALRR